MSKARTLAGTVSTGAILADGTIDASEIGSLTLPSGGDIVGTTSTQTLTNKTIDIASNTLTGVQASLVSGTNIKTVNGGSVLGSGDLAVGGGSMIFISSVTANGAATADIETGFDSTYDNYVILFSGVVPSSNGATLCVHLKIGGVYRTSDYRNASLGGPTGQATYSGSADFFQLSSGGGLSNLAKASNNGEFWVFNPASTTLDKNIKWFFQGFSAATDTAQTTLGSGRYKDTGSTDALTGVRFYMSSGDISGTFRLYGYKNS